MLPKLLPVLPEFSTLNALANNGSLRGVAATKTRQPNPRAAKKPSHPVPAAGLEPALRFHEKGF
jgi:hypothetical protein